MKDGRNQYDKDRAKNIEKKNVNELQAFTPDMKKQRQK